MNELSETQIKTKDTLVKLVNSNGFATRWAERLVRFCEPSDRNWSGETPLGRMQHLDPCHYVLDIGCGVGNALDELRSKGHSVAGVDIEPSNVHRAGERGFDVVQADMHHLPFADETFDGVLLWDVFEHSFAPLVVLWECDRVLKSGGRILMYLPPSNWKDHHVHTIIPTEEQLTALLGKTNLKIEQVTKDLNMGSQVFIVKK